MRLYLQNGAALRLRLSQTACTVKPLESPSLVTKGRRGRAGRPQINYSRQDWCFSGGSEVTNMWLSGVKAAVWQGRIALGWRCLQAGAGRKETSNFLSGSVSYWLQSNIFLCHSLERGETEDKTKLTRPGYVCLQRMIPRQQILGMYLSRGDDMITDTSACFRLTARP